MKAKKLISAMLTGTMAISLVGSLSASADEEKIYTLSELIEMDNEEFLTLDDTEHFVEWMELNYENGGTLQLRFCSNTRNDDKYEYYKTEKKLQNVIGENTEYVFSSPITHESYGYYDEYLIIENEEYIITDITYEDIIYIAKVWYCFNQVISCSYCGEADWALSSSSINYGEANGDDILTAADAAFIAKKLAEQNVDELPETADFNADGEITALDCAKIAQYLAAKSIAKAEGMIK